jgi:hypothetical protein
VTDIITALEAIVSILKGANKLWGLINKKGAKPKTIKSETTTNTD